MRLVSLNSKVHFLPNSCWGFWFRSVDKMMGKKVEDRLDGATNFIFWKPRVLLILEENDLLKFVNEKVPELEAEEDESQWRKNDARARRLLLSFLIA